MRQFKHRLKSGRLEFVWPFLCGFWITNPDNMQEKNACAPLLAVRCWFKFYLLLSFYGALTEMGLTSWVLFWVSLAAFKARTCLGFAALTAFLKTRCSISAIAPPSDSAVASLHPSSCVCVCLCGGCTLPAEHLLVLALTDSSSQRWTTRHFLS